MFDSEPSAKQFLRALEKLSQATKNSKPATMHNSVVRILKAADGFSGSKMDDLISHISTPPKRGSRTSSKTTSKSKLKPHSAKLVSEILRSLDSLVHSREQYETKVKEYANSCGAKTLKAVAAAFAASTEPPTKAAALKLLLSERANRVRTGKKISESAKASPW